MVVIYPSACNGLAALYRVRVTELKDPALVPTSPSLLPRGVMGGVMRMHEERHRVVTVQQCHLVAGLASSTLMLLHGGGRTFPNSTQLCLLVSVSQSPDRFRSLFRINLIGQVCASRSNGIDFLSTLIKKNKKTRWS